jgi:hypothetical protein
MHNAIEDNDPPTLRHPPPSPAFGEPSAECEGPIKALGWFRGFTMGRGEPNVSDWRWLDNQDSGRHAGAETRPQDFELFTDGMAEGAADLAAERD